MDCFHYDEFTGEFLAWTHAMADPLDNPDGEPDKPWLIPRFATIIQPPPLVYGNVLVFREGAWGYLLPDDMDGTPSPDPIEVPPKDEAAADKASEEDASP